MIPSLNFFSLILTIFFVSFIAVFFMLDTYQKRKKILQTMRTEVGLLKTYQNYQNLALDLVQEVQSIRNQLFQLKTSLLQLLDHSAIAAAFMDQKNQFIRYNSSFARITGLSKRNDTEVSLVDFPVFGSILLKMTEPSQIIDIGQMRIEIHRVQSDLGCFFVLTDMRAQEIEEGERRYLANAIWHEMKTPLTVMKGYSKLLLEEITEAGALKTCQKIDSQIERLEKVTSQLRLLTYTETIKGETTDAQTLVEIIHQVLSSYQSEIAVLQLQVRLDFHAIEKIHVPISFRRGDLFILISNLISNAIHFNHQRGSVDISLFIQNDNLIFQVEDTGSGISLEMRDLIFKPLGYASAVGEKSQGIGLYLVKEAANRGGGRITVQSQVGKGTIVRIFIPFR